MLRCRWVLWPMLVIAAIFCDRGLSMRPAAVAQTAAAQGEPASESEPETAEPRTAETDPLRSPLQVMRTFIVAMEDKDFAVAVGALDFSAIEPTPDEFGQIRYAQKLKAVIDRMPLFDSSEISDESEGPPFGLPPDKADAVLTIARGEDGVWRFSAETVKKVDALYEVLSEKPPEPQDTEPAESKPEDEPAEERPTESDEKTGEPIEPAGPLPVVPPSLRSARQTMRTLLVGLEDREYELAVTALDFSAMDPEMGPYRKLGYARRLKDVIDRLALIDYGQIGDDPEAPAFRFPPDGATQPVEISRDEAGAWQFSAETVRQIDALWELYKDKPVLNLATEERAWYDRELLLGNEMWRILALFATIFASLLLGQFLRAILKAWGNSLQRRGRTVGAVAMTTLAKTALPVFFLVGLNAGVQVLVLDHDVETGARTVIQVIFALVVGYILFRMVDVVVELLRNLASKSGSTLNDMLVPIVSTSLRLTVIVLVLLEIAMAVSDKPPSSVIAGLGAGGLAIGLAAQDTIKNFFGSMMIFADRPFELGERIIVDGHDGPVESVGFRSTRIRTLDGHLVTVPNGEMAYKTILNIGKRPHIRRVMNLRIASDTASEKARRALTILRELLTDHEGMNEEFPPKVFLSDVLETALVIRVIYWYHSLPTGPPDYWDYCDFSERLNLQVIERFQAEEIRFAMPSQRLFVSDAPESSGSPPKRG